MPSPLYRLLAPLVALLALSGCISSSVRNPEFVPPTGETHLQYRARLHTELGAGYLARGQHSVALEELATATKIDPGYAPAYNMYGLVYMDLREEAAAERSFQRAIELAPQDPEIRNNYGWYLCERNKEKASLEQFELAVRNPLYRTPELALNNAGRCSARIGEIKSAEQFFRQAVALRANFIQAYQGLAEIYFKSARLEEARTQLKFIMQFPNPAAESLWLGACVEQKLGDREAENAYALQLRRRFPDAAETKRLSAGSCD